MLERYPKWQPIVSNSLEQHLTRGRCPAETTGSGSSGKRVREDADVDLEYGDLLDTPTSDRPEGIKKAKSRLRGKGKADSTIEAFQSFNERLKLHNEHWEVDAAAERERLEIVRKKEERKQKQLEMEQKQLEMMEFKNKWDMLQMLKNNPNREDYEEAIYEQLIHYFSTQKF